MRGYLYTQLQVANDFKQVWVQALNCLVDAIFNYMINGRVAVCDVLLRFLTSGCVMTQLYIGNLSAEADEKTVRAVFGKYGMVRDTVMKNGYAFLAFDNPMSADAAVKEMNGE